MFLAEDGDLAFSDHVSVLVLHPGRWPFLPRHHGPRRRLHCHRCPVVSHRCPVVSGGSLARVAQWIGAQSVVRVRVGGSQSLFLCYIDVSLPLSFTSSL